MLKGMQTFTIIWFGQLVSLLGTAMTRFALLIWAYEQTGSATTLALLGFFAFIFQILLSPLAGIVIDHFDRRTIMMVTDLGSGIMTLGMLALYSTGNLEIWHLYVAEALIGALETFQRPAYSTATTTLIPKKHYARAMGMRSLAANMSTVVAPFFAGALLAFIDIDGVMLIDVITFLIAMVTLLLVRIPRPETSVDGQAASGNWRHELRFGFNYVRQRPGLRGLLIIFMGIDVFATLAYFSILPAMVLARTGNDELALAAVQSALGIGGVVGGLLLSVWGGPRRKIHSIFIGTALSYALGDLVFAVGRSVEVWIVAAFLAALFIPFISGSYHAIWQVKVAPDIQGRVFAVRNMFTGAAMLIGYLIAGPLADVIFEPAMQPGGSLTGIFGGLVGVGPGAGMAAIFIFTAAFGMIISLSGYLIPTLRNVEADVPDYDETLALETAM